METSGRDNTAKEALLRQPATIAHRLRHARAPCVIFFVFVTVITILSGVISVPKETRQHFYAPVNNPAPKWRKLTSADNYTIDYTTIDEKEAEKVGPNISPTIKNVMNKPKNPTEQGKSKKKNEPVKATPKPPKPASAGKVKVVPAPKPSATGKKATPKPKPATAVKVITPAPPPAPKPQPTPPWISCGKLKYGSPLFPKTALATFPGSGNTWTRHLIQQLTGYYTGAVYNDLALKKKGFPGEYVRDGRVIVIKTHLTAESHRNGFAKAVVVMRSPYDCLKAEFNRRSRGHTGFAKSTALSSDAYQRYLKVEIPHWRGWHNVWLNFKGKILVLYYEDMLKDLRGPLKQLCKYLNVEKICTEEKIQCVIENSKGNFKRKKGVQPETIYTNANKKLIETYKKEVYGLLNKCIDNGRCAAAHKMET